ncbi:MAG: cobyric acid synthase, partial [Chloroflexi bacterium]|nr:cobyric acid synthase [Chloroflexota bacterium]
MEGITGILVDLFILFAAAKVAGELFTRLRQPPIVGEVLAGVLIGPHALGLIGLPDSALIELFGGDEKAAEEALTVVLDVIAELGVIILLFFVGLETRLSELLEVGGRATMVAVLGIIFPFILGFAFIWLTDPIGTEDLEIEAAFVATAMVATSIGITARVLGDIGAIRTREARIILGAAVVDDILALLMLSVVVGLGGDDFDALELGLTALAAVAFVVFAALVGTLDLLEPEERETIKGFVINKFRGDPSLLTDGLDMLEARTGIPVLGVIHHFHDIHIPEEDSVALDLPVRSSAGALLDIVVIKLPHVSNFDDFDPLARENGVTLRYVESHSQMGRPDLIILPGSKTTMADLAWMESQGLSGALRELHSQGTAVVGICGGYQMLGEKLYDPDKVESSRLEMDGLGLLPLTTVFEGTKETHRIQGRVAEGRGLLTGAVDEPITGYEIHMARTTGTGSSGSFTPAPFIIEDRSDVPVTAETASDGALDSEGRVLGTYIHGLFHNGGLRRAMLKELARKKGLVLPLQSQDLVIDQEFDKLAAWVRASLN